MNSLFCLYSRHQVQSLLLSNSYAFTSLCLDVDLCVIIAPARHCQLLKQPWFVQILSDVFSDSWASYFSIGVLHRMISLWFQIPSMICTFFKFSCILTDPLQSTIVLNFCLVMNIFRWDGEGLPRKIYLLILFTFPILNIFFHPFGPIDLLSILHRSYCYHVEPNTGENRIMNLYAVMITINRYIWRKR